MERLGKTTLARHLYEHEVDEGPFNGQKIWICLSENFDVVRLLKEMVESVTKTPCELKNTGAIMGKLEENLKGKKLFLVLDDVWNNDKHLWDSFKSQLQKIGVLARSVILVTTRSNDVAKKASASCLHKLRGLWKEDGWALLKQQVSFDSSFNDVGRRILDKCKGAPLAIKAIGGILQLMESHSDWCRIEKSEVWEIQHHEDANYIMPSLLLSYNHFKHVSLKRCFALCAIFPKDKIMSKSELIYLWLAQGLIYDEPSNYSTTITAETIGENYIDILVNHSFLLECYETKYMMHDLVHDLASYVSKKDLVVCKGGEKLEDVDSHIQHLAFDLSINETTPEILIEKKLSKLRTIIFWRGVPRWNSLICAPYIRTLIMDNIGLSEVPAFIGQLLHLRYLDLSNNPIHALPESICKLYQLQTLRLFRCLVQELPSELHRLENLRHIETSRWLVASKGMGQLTSLQTLPYLKLCDREGWTIDELGPLYQVKGEINIEGLEYVKNKEEAREARLIRKDKILKLSFHWSFSGEEEVNYGGQINSSIIERCNHDKDVLESLEPHPNIQSLRIMGYMGVRFPRWMREMGGHPTTKLNSLTNVELYTCDRCLQLPSLGMLPNLKVLCLSELNAVECIGEEFYYSNNNSCAEVGVNKKVLFPNLRELSIMDFESLTTWEPPSSSATVLPSLETLVIVTCPKLRKIPTSLENCTSLQNLEIEDCPSMEGEGSVPNLGKLHGLINLRLHDTGELLSLLPLWIPHLRSLIELSIAGLREEWDITLMSSLAPFRSLSLVGCRNFKPLPAQQVFPALHMSSTLQSLVIFGFDEMEALPEWIGKLLSLQTLHLSNCNKLKYLFSTQAMLQLAQLQCLYIQACPLLTERCEKDSNGPESEWHKISHLSNIRIDWVTIQDLR
ncbi:putative disease resistance protein RGA3 [Bienertia sinuspersici]